VSKSWFELFKRLGALRSRVYGRWTMKDGARFHFAIPSHDKVGETTFSDDVEFPFTYSEIVSLEIPRKIGQGKLALENDLTSIQTAFPIEGLRVTVDSEQTTLSVSPNISS
jgi:hypothetical protein